MYLNLLMKDSKLNFFWLNNIKFIIIFTIIILKIK